MKSIGRLVCLVWVVSALGAGVLGLQRPPPRYSQQYMPETSFTCRNKIVGSYYADPETDCQVFHVCVSVAGTVQDYKFLCPNDTAFDQESQTCADWYDVDCEAATLYYASDNFDLYRIGSGLESLHYDSIRSDAEPQDHLQRSETSDPVRSSANTLNRVQPSNSYNGNRDLRGSSSGNFYNNRNGKDEDYENERPYKDEVAQEKKKTGVRKVSRKQQYNDNGSNSYVASSTSVPAPAPANQNTYTGFYSGNNYNQRANGFVPSTTARPQESFNKNQNTPRYNTPSSTYRPSTVGYQNNYNFQSPSTTTRTTIYNAYNANSNYNQQNAAGFSQSTTAKPFSQSTSYSKNYNQNYNNGGQPFAPSTTLQPSTSYQANDYSNYQRNYNNIQRTSNNNVPYQSTTASPTIYDNNYNNNNNNNGQYRPSTTIRQDVSQSTTKYFPSYASSNYAPTTYSPATKKYIPNDNAQAQTAVRNNENGQYYEKSSQPVKSSSQYYEVTRAPKKATQYNNYEGSNGKYYTETSTGTYDLARSSVGIGFSPASINHLAETARPTTPVPRRISTVTTYNPNIFNSNTQRPPQSPTTPRESTYVSGSARPFSSTTRLPSTTTPRPKSGKKNDYDYAYYDNTAGLEYDSLDLEHVAGNKESTKIARN
ncbi:GATA zinc finger domain-containing protein 14-like [Frieseomelitta varia]|uniref:GATA zinc finger domain-containing protein 14-like n=1 Tax=Frieseomelitta varia TaxID=561572 RepID=UPI001CB6A301|nr:GATA zinc finger domain-containing protein 14-like [Frieseomelitta varia]